CPSRHGFAGRRRRAGQSRFPDRCLAAGRQRPRPRQSPDRGKRPARRAQYARAGTVRPPGGGAAASRLHLPALPARRPRRRRGRALAARRQADRRLGLGRRRRRLRAGHPAGAAPEGPPMKRWPFHPAGRAAAALACTSLVASPLLAQANSVGIEAAIRNKVEIRAAATKKVKPAVLHDRVFLGDQAQTDKASQLQILLLDLSTFTVGASARVTIDRFVYDPATNLRDVGISVARGAFRFMSGRSVGKPTGPVSVPTPVATIGIRGTIFAGVVGAEAEKIAEREPAVGKVKSDSDEASLIVLRGPGPRTQGDTTPGAIDVSAGDRTATLNEADLAAYVPRRGAAPIVFR